MICFHYKSCSFFSTEMSNKEAQQQIDDLIFKLNDVPQNMRAFSQSMRSLYAESAVGTSADAAKRFRSLRDDIRKNADAYVKEVLPVVKQCVSNIKSLFEYYQDLSMDEWSENIDHIIEETNAHRNACNSLITVHEEITDSLKKRQTDAVQLINELTDLSVKYERQAKQPEESSMIVYYLLLILHALSYLIRTIMNIFPRNSVHTNLVEDIAAEKEAEIQAEAAKIVRDGSIPALSKFVDGIKDIARFFVVVCREMTGFHNKENTSRDAQELKHLHYNTMRDKAGQVMGACNRFIAELPSIRSDLDAIPTEGTDQNFVDRWKENQKAVVMDRKGPSKNNKRE